MNRITQEKSLRQSQMLSFTWSNQNSDKISRQPPVCISSVGEAKVLGQKFYQYTTIDVCSFRYIIDEQKAYSSMIFFENFTNTCADELRKKWSLSR